MKALYCELHMNHKIDLFTLFHRFYSENHEKSAPDRILERTQETRWNREMEGELKMSQLLSIKIICAFILAYSDSYV